MNPNISNLLADAGGAAGFWLVVMRFWTQFQNLVGLLKDVAEWTKAEIEVFASRTVVIATRQIWWVILPVMLALAIASTISAWHVDGHWEWWSLNLAFKISALSVAVMTARMVFRVQHIPENPTQTSQDEINKAYGEPWLFMPMVRNALLNLVVLTGALLSDTFLLADRVGFYHSMFSAILFVIAMLFTLSFALAMLVGVYALVASGIEVGGGAWGGFIVPLATVSIPGLTGLNNRVIQISAEQRSKLRSQMWEVLVDNKFAGGAMAAWVVLFISFHSPLAWLIELATLIVLVGVLIAYVWITGKVLLRMAENVVIIICATGIISFFWRLIDAGVGPQEGESHLPVLFYDRLWRLLLWIGGGFGDGSAIHDPIGFADAVTPTFVFALLVMAALAFYFSTKIQGTPSTALATIAIIMAVAGCGMILVRTAFAEDPAPAVASEEADDNGLGDLIPRHTVNAGSHDNSPAHACSMSDPSRPCP
ncbi:hypothetical protein M0Q28_04000 [Patescibacteria group bacterium]|jgi:hypothetical protein|nr:hypothetical protein [Patescibacteria group bacterium]